MSSLIILSLISNKFHGSIPLKICLLVHILFLDMSKNNILGTIPRCLNNLAAMAYKVSNVISEDYIFQNDT